jgi:1,2-phenylacetyl-CoA epoxidase catalytic subunit
MSLAKETPDALKRMQAALTKALPFVIEIFEAWEKAAG